MKPMVNPSALFPTTPATTPSMMPPVLPDPSIFGDAFDQLLNNRGVRFIHQRAVPCPNIKSHDDNTHDPLCPHCDGSGLFYYKEKEIIGMFVSNSIERQFEYNGAWEQGAAIVTLPTLYDDGEPADFSIYDRLVCTDFTVRLYEQKEYEPRSDSKQQLRYPIERVQYLATANSSSVTEYIEDVDFTIEDGKIKWTDGHTPSYDHVNDRGQVFSVAYYAFPIFVVLQPMRELRITQELIGASKQAKRLPQQVVVRRDFYVNPPEKVSS